MATVGFAVRCFLGGVIVGGVGAILGAFFLLTSPRSNKKDGKGNDEKEKSNNKRIDTNLKKYGFDNPWKSTEIREKIKQTNLKKTN